MRRYGRKPDSDNAMNNPGRDGGQFVEASVPNALRKYIFTEVDRIHSESDGTPSLKQKVSECSRPLISALKSYRN